MSKPRSTSRQSARREHHDQTDALSGGEMQGRPGEPLSRHEKTVLGDNEPWERAEESALPKRRQAAKEKILEMEYERGPGSKFEIEGLGRKPRKTSNRKGLSA